MKIIIEGIHPYDGEYQLDMERLTNRDIRTIKQVSGLRPLEYEEAGAKGDNDFVLAMTMIALRRSGQHATIDEDILLDADIGKITVDLDDQEATSDPPELGPETLGTPSGSPSPTDGDSQQAKTLRLTGTDSSEP